MDIQSLKQVTLPDGNVVEISNDPLPWWRIQFASGFVSPHCIAPDPNQPRRHIDPTELEELYESIKVSGVRQSLVITPLELAPWIEVAPEHRHAFFGAVSGHRRREGAIRADQEAVPVEIRIYPSSKEYKMDASILNSNHADLTPLEEGYELVQLRAEGWTVEELCQHFGMAAPQYYLRVNLTRLHPDIQELLNPELQEKKRLPTTTAGALGNVKVPTVAELDQVLEVLGSDANPENGVMNVYFEALTDDERRFEYQWMLLRVILKRGLKSVRAMNFIKEHALKLSAVSKHGGRKTARYRPEKKREIVVNLAKTVQQSVLVDWTPAEFRATFETATAEEMETYIKGLQNAGQSLADFIRILEQIQNKKRPAAA